MSSQKDGALYKILDNGGWTVGITMVSGSALLILAALLYIGYIAFREVAIVTTFWKNYSDIHEPTFAI